MTMRIIRQEWHEGKAKRAAREGGVEGLARAGDLGLALSNEGVPVLSGDLRDSGRTDVDEDSMTVSISYDTEYAIKQHEDTSLSHPRGRAKWLQLAMQQAANKFPGIFKDSLGRRF
jgi:hypothetical protein